MRMFNKKQPGVVKFTAAEYYKLKSRVLEIAAMEQQMLGLSNIIATKRALAFSEAGLDDLTASYRLDDETLTATKTTAEVT